MSEPSGEVHERLAVELKNAYARLRSLTSPGFRHQAKHEGKWLDLARWLHGAGAGGRHYIKWAYDRFRRHRPMVYVEMITSSKTVQAYLRANVDRERDFAILIRLQWRTLRGCLDRGMTPREIIESSGVELGVVFKYALACRERLADLAERMRPDAEAELYFEPLYRKYLSADFLPNAG